MAQRRRSKLTIAARGTLPRASLAAARETDEAFRAWQRALAERVELPAPASVIGEPVTVVDVDYAGNPRRGVIVRCRRPDGREYSVSVADVGFADGTEGARLVARYREWIGLEPAFGTQASAARGQQTTQTAGDDLDLSRPVELAVLAVKEGAARTRRLGSHESLTLRTSGLWKVVPGDIATIHPRRQWRYAGHPYLSGDITDVRLDVPALGLVPLRLDPFDTWDPAEEYWGEEGEPLEDWARAVIARGPRPAFEMEQVPPGTDPGDPDSDPIIESNDLKDAGDVAGARRILMALLAADLRCLDAHAHLGNLLFDGSPGDAVRHYEVGVRIAELSLGEGFDGVLPWGLVDNRPFLRCLNGYGLCLWRLGRLDEAARVFDRMLWMNPSDNQGIRSLLPAVRAGERWEDGGRQG
jgi:tetratricopeptide (TPR) repeat protein